MRRSGIDGRRPSRLRARCRTGVEYAGPGARRSNGRSIRAADASKNQLETGDQVRRIVDARTAESRKDYCDGSTRQSTPDCVRREVEESQPGALRGFHGPDEQSPLNCFIRTFRGGRHYFEETLQWIERNERGRTVEGFREN